MAKGQQSSSAGDQTYAGAARGRSQPQPALSRLAAWTGLIEMVGLVLCSMLASYVRDGEVWRYNEYVTATALTIVLAGNILYFSGSYSYSVRPEVSTRQLLALTVWTLSFLIVVTMFYLLGAANVFGRQWVLLFWSFGGFLILLTRTLVFASILRMQAASKLAVRIAVIGQGTGFENTVATLISAPSGLYWIEQTVDLSDLDPEELDTHEGLSKLKARIREGKVEQIILCFDRTGDRRLLEVFQRFRHESVAIALVDPHLPAEIPVLGLELREGRALLKLTERPLSGVDGLVKAVEDRVLGLVFLLIASPFMLGIAAAILLTDGRPIIFRQHRSGFRSNEFVVYKFRTMTAQDNGADVPQASRADPRVTRIGRFLRATSLDELPQLFNVVKGDMSLVGPRPHALAHDSIYMEQIDGYLGRHRVKPGLTGWAQVNGLRGETDTVDKMRRRVEYDLHYIDNWSLALDLRIILMTIGEVIASKSAY